MGQPQNLLWLQCSLRLFSSQLCAGCPLFCLYLLDHSANLYRAQMPRLRNTAGKKQAESRMDYVLAVKTEKKTQTKTTTSKTNKQTKKNTMKEQKNRIIYCKVDSKTLCSWLDQQVGAGVASPRLRDRQGQGATGPRPGGQQGAGVGGRGGGRPPCHSERRRRWL